MAIVLASSLYSPVHGIGLSNVKKEAEKYCGNMDIQINEQEFRVTVLLQGKGGGEMNHSHDSGTA